MLNICDTCGTPYVESNLDFLSPDLRHVAKKLKYKPACQCLQKQSDQEALERLEEERKHARKEEIERRYREARLAPRFRRRRFESYIPYDVQQEEVLAVCRKFAECFEEWRKEEIHSLLIAGQTDRGKSHLAQSIANVLVKGGYTLIYENWARVLSRFRRAFKEGNAEDEKVPLLECDALVLDDVGVGSTDEWVSANLYEILEFRLEWERPTVITTNLTLEELGNSYGERVASRLQRGYRIVRL